jgi:hypothetical protein
VTIASGYKAIWHLYDTNGNWIWKSGFDDGVIAPEEWITGPVTVNTTAIQALHSDAVYFRVSMGKTNNLTLTPNIAMSAKAIELTASSNLVLTDNITWEATSIQPPIA